MKEKDFNFRSGNLIEVVTKARDGVKISPFLGYCIKVRNSGDYPRIQIFNRKFGVIKNFPLNENLFEFKLVQNSYLRRSRSYFIYHASIAKIRERLRKSQ